LLSFSKQFGLNPAISLNSNSFWQRWQLILSVNHGVGASVNFF
jgi:hypothetical protein